MVEEDIEIIGAMIIIEAGIGPEKEYSQGFMVTIGIEVPVIVDQGQDLELVLIECCVVPLLNFNLYSTLSLYKFGT